MYTVFKMRIISVFREIFTQKLSPRESLAGTKTKEHKKIIFLQHQVILDCNHKFEDFLLLFDLE